MSSRVDSAKTMNDLQGDGQLLTFLEKGSISGLTLLYLR